jgi:pimeloyl-ACP methyl ester carboxylesterase
VEHEGADLVYDLTGEGPLLLLIAGGGGDGARYREIAGELAGDYTVISYDRRGNSRSTGDPAAYLDMAQQARDAAAVISSARPAAARAAVFGNGGGGSIALELAAHLPDMVTELVVHEAPMLPLLPDAPKWLSFMREVRTVFEREGAGSALKLFHSEFAGFEDSDGPAFAAHAIPNSEFFFAREYLPIMTYTPDLDTVRRTGIPVVIAAGALSADAYYARTARLQAEHLACRYVEFPGDHRGFALEPVAFAKALSDAFRGLRKS